MLISTDSFIDALEKWLIAVRAGEMGAAQSCADHMQMHGELLVMHPMFRKSFQSHWPALEPGDALDHLTRFLICATEVRAAAVRNGHLSHTEQKRKAM